MEECGHVNSKNWKFENGLKYVLQLLDTMSMHAIPYTDKLLQVCNNYVTCYITIYIYVHYVYVLGIR